MALNEVPDRLGALAEVVKGDIAAALEAEKEAISDRIAVAWNQAMARAEATRQHVIAEHDAAIAAMEAETAAALETLPAEHETAMGQIDELETDGLDTINILYADSRQEHEGLGGTVGDEAITRGEEYYDAYAGCKIYEADSFWAGHLTDRRAEAQQNAAREVARGYRRSLEREARNQAREAMKGRPKDRCGVIAAARRARNTLDDQFEALGTALAMGLEQARQSAAAHRDQLLTSIDDAITATLRTLNQQEHSQCQAANDTAYLQQVAVEQVAYAAAAALQTTVADAVDSIQQALLEVRGTLAALPAPTPYLLEKLLSQATTTLDRGLQQLTTQVDSGAAQAEERLVEASVQARMALANVTQSNDEQTAVVSDGFSTSMVALVAGASAAFAQRIESYIQQVQTATTDGIAGFQQVVTGFEESLTTITTNVEMALVDSAARLDQSLHDSLAGIDCEIPKQAMKAASKEQPAWKTVVAVLLIIAVIVVVALVLGPAVIGAVGAAASALGAGAAASAIGAIVGGAIVGAATSATIQVINNWRTGQDLSQGVGRAAIMGAIGGAFGGGAGFLIGKYVSSQVLQFAANIAADAVLELGTQLVTGEFSWEALGMSMLMSLATGGFGEIGGIKRVQARMQHRGARVVPGGGASAYAESIRPPTGIESGTSRPEVEGSAPPKPVEEGRAPRPEAERATPRRPAEGDIAPPGETARPRPETEVEAAAPRPEVARPRTEVEDAGVTARPAPRAELGAAAPPRAAAEAPTAEGKFRETLGWSGQPTRTPAAGQEHLGLIQRALHHTDRIHPELRTRLDELLPRIDDPLPAHQQRINELGEELNGIYHSHENRRIVNQPRDTVEHRMGPEAAAQRDRLMQRIEEIEVETTRLQREIKDEGARLEQEALDLMTTLRNRLRSRGRRGAAERAEQVTFEGTAERALAARGRTPEQAKRDMSEFYEFIRTRGPNPASLRVTSMKARAEATPGRVDIGETASKRVIFHEMGHHIEFTRPELVRASQAFVEARARHVGREGELVPLRDLAPTAGYEPHEIARVGGFIDPYTGKVYPAATEVISTGMERFTDPRAMLDFYRQDMEHFFYVLGAIL
jgi:hypothetical protein